MSSGCQYVIVNMLECNYSAKVSIWKLFRMSSWCQNILARKVVQNVFMMSEHFIQKISTYTVFLVLTTSWLSTDWLRNLWTCSVLLVLLLNCYLHPTLDSCILKRKNLIHAETLTLSHSHTLTRLLFSFLCWKVTFSHSLTLTLSHSLIHSLSTCWTSFVFISMLKSRCL